jgi:hypothetical protein
MERLARLATALTLLACSGADSVAARATVFFAIDAPLCSSIIPVVFLIDNEEVGTDTFVVNLGSPHLTSRGFEISAGQHTLSARVSNGFVWPDQRVNLVRGQTFTHMLPFYCS